MVNSISKTTLPTLPETADETNTRKSSAATPGEEKVVVLAPVTVAVNDDDIALVPDELRPAALRF